MPSDTGGLCDTLITKARVSELAWPLGGCEPSVSVQAFLGVFIAVPLRTQTILRENLRFPSGTATAKVIRTLHGLPEDDASFGRAGAGAPQHPAHVSAGLPVRVCSPAHTGLFGLQAALAACHHNKLGLVLVVV